jgi:hypothetical protein
MINLTSEKDIITSIISNVLGNDSFTIYLNKLIVLKMRSSDYVCEIEFLKDSSDLPVIFTYEKGELGYVKENSEYWEIEDFSWEETFKQLQYYINYYSDLLKDFYDVSIDELDSYSFERAPKYVDLKKLGKGSTIVFKFRKKF